MHIAAKRVLFGLVFIAAVLALDQLSKGYLIPLLTGREEIALVPFFNLVMVWNSGISFGLLAQYNQALVLIVLSLVICAILAVWLMRADSRLVAGALGTVIGGALGNVADRLRFGAVADFFDFHLGGYHWPAFNIADAAIFIGVVLLCADSMLTRPKPRP